MKRKRGVTLIELMLAIALLAVIASIVYFTFDAGVKAWRTGTELADSLHHADYIMEQLVMGLRSAYYPDAERPVGDYGFVHEDDGADDLAHDTISWVKLGTALVGNNASLAGTPHRVEVTVRPPESTAGSADDEGGLTVRAWRIAALPEDFDAETDIAPLRLTPRIVALNCRVLDPENNLAQGKSPPAEEELEWTDEWTGDRTNRLPYAVEIALYLAPSREQDPPIEIKRVIELPLAPLSWRDKGAAGGRTPTGEAQPRSRSRRPNRQRPTP